MTTIWITYILFVAAIAGIVEKTQGNDNTLSNSLSPNGNVSGNTIINYYDSEESETFTATIPGKGNTLSNAGSTKGKITGNTIVNYLAKGSKTSDSDKNLLSNVDSANGSVTNNRVINYYGDDSEVEATNPPTQPQRERPLQASPMPIAAQAFKGSPIATQTSAMGYYFDPTGNVKFIK